MINAYEIPGGLWEIYFDSHYSTILYAEEFGDFIAEVLSHGMDIHIYTLESSCV